MPDQYYYLVSTLPTLEFGPNVPMKSEIFLSECGKWLSDKDFNVISRLKLNGLNHYPDDPPEIKEWKAFNFELRTELARIRAAKLSGSREDVPESLKDIFKETTPLLKEKKFEEIRWEYIEDKETGHYFDTGKLVFYFLKLQINERAASYDKEKGLAKFEKLCEVNYA